jgi:hypothetical protein
LTRFGESVSVRAVKLLLPLLSASLFLTACSSPKRDLWAQPQPYGRSDNNVTRRTLYSPSPASGPYTASLYNGAWKQNGKPMDEEWAARQEQQRIQEMEAKPAAQPAQ